MKTKYGTYVQSPKSEGYFSISNQQKWQSVKDYVSFTKMIGMQGRALINQNTLVSKYLLTF